MPLNLESCFTLIEVTFNYRLFTTFKWSVYVVSPIFRKWIPVSAAAGRVSTGSNFPLLESTLSLMLDHLALRIQAHIKLCAI